jgi:hypothetical protein
MNVQPNIGYPISFLMPVCNEEEVIEQVVLEWINEVILKCPTGSELILDDSSTDGTTSILKRLKKTYPMIHVYTHPKDGFFNAAKRLYQKANNQVVFFTDSDGQYVASEFWKLPQLYKDWTIVNGEKIVRKDPFYRIFASKVFNFFVRRFFGLTSKDSNSAFRLMDKRIVDQILPQERTMRTLLNSELTIRAHMANYDIISVPIIHRDRAIGKSRGLPLKSFLRESCAAFTSLLTLKNELQIPAHKNRKLSVEDAPKI